MKKYFENPTMEVVQFESEDVITVSALILDGEGGSPKVVSYDTIAYIFGDI